MSSNLDTQLATFRATHRPVRARFAGIEWSYIVGGSGPDTLLLLPGAPGIAEMAFPYIVAFERHRRVIAPSYPADIGSLAQLLDGLDGLLAAEAVDGPIHLIGASYSGMVAQYLVCRHAGRVASLLIGDTGVPRPDRALALRVVIAAIAQMPRLGLHATLAAVLAYVLKGDTPSHSFWQRYFKGVVAILTVPEFVNRVRVMIDMDRQGHLIRPPVCWDGPTLLLETAADPLFSSAERAGLRARYPHAETHTFHSRGHITALTRFREYITVMEEFLARQRP
ncbi:alpha/beta hydrolase [Oscillochloris sp. ZM17-4]|uniref:alpha/beta fold hydrolase n=1 Tax=Oscillochloris sp. ZM17-4 TaxID=2866714 RepID=UPI001C72D881|nr:alpha/beta hydrolase [Oscillochloris sp. ZM17-4]MBX0328134.1 alpha/beta hydrolase [Oscillochloris sp. ZM17-4]